MIVRMPWRSKTIPAIVTLLHVCAPAALLPAPVDELSTLPTNASCSVVSPDGRSVLIYGDTELRLRDWKSGIDQHVIRVEDSSPNGIIDSAVLSPDGRHVAYGWRKNGSYQVRIVNDSETRVLLERDSGLLQPRAWSPDGTHLLIWIANDTEITQTALLNVQDASIRLLRESAGVSVSRYAFSPDSRFVIYSVRDGGRRQARVMALDSDFDEPLLGQSDSHGWYALWTATGNVLFLKNDAGQLKLISVPIKNGRPVGEPQVLAPEFDRAAYSVCGVTPDNTVLYTVAITKTQQKLRAVRKEVR